MVEVVTNFFHSIGLAGEDWIRLLRVKEDDSRFINLNTFDERELPFCFPLTPKGIFTSRLRYFETSIKESVTATRKERKKEEKLCKSEI